MPGDDAEHAEHVERVRLLLHGALPIIIGGNLFSGTLTAGVLSWLAFSPAHWWWWGVLMGVVVLRVVTVMRWRRRGVDAGNARIVARRFALMTWFSGLVWGLGAVAFIDLEQTFALILLVAVLAGVAAGGIGPHAPYFPVYAGYVAGVLLPPVLYLLTQADPLAWMLAAMGIALFVSDMLIAHRVHCHVVDAIRVRYRNLELTQALEARNREVERANEVKSRFLAAASHDIRQPLHSMNLLVDMLRRADDPARRERILDRLHASLGATNGMLTGLLDLSRLDAGVVQVNRDVFGLASVLERLTALFEPIARERGVRLRVRPSPAVVHSDPALLESILQNLLANAVRYCDGGSALVAARRRGDHWRIEVRDNGPGIAPDDQSQVFEEFRRARHGGGDDAGAGLGLGLAIVRRLARLLGHGLDLCSARDRGACFAIRVPAALAAADEATSTADLHSAGVRVLLLDDDAQTREATAALLEQRGCRVHPAGTIAESAGVRAAPGRHGDRRS